MSTQKPSPLSSSVLSWFEQYPYPHCQKVSSLASLRTGVAIAEVMTLRLPSSYHPLFLSATQIYNLTPQKCISNLKVLLNALRMYMGSDAQLLSQLDQFTAQGLYFDHNMMEAFVTNILIQLKDQVQGQENEENGRQNGQEHNQLANLSSIIIDNDNKINSSKVTVNNIKNKQDSQRINHNSYKKKQKKPQKPVISNKLNRWLSQMHHIDHQQLSHDRIIGQLVNSIFAGSRLNSQLIVKPSHYELGQMIVFNKVCDYLLEIQRMPKKNVLLLLEQLQEGLIQEQHFWLVIEDLMNLKMSHNVKTKNSRSKTKASRQATNHNQNSGKEQNQLQQKRLAELQIKKNKSTAVQYDYQTIFNAQKWIRDELGYQFSLNKSKQKINILENPVLNGVLLGSITMRMQFGKLNINKHPSTPAHVQNNIAQMANCIIRRGIESARKFFSVKPNYNAYIGIMWQVKNEHQQKLELQKQKRNMQQRATKELTQQVSQQQKKLLCDWLKNRGFNVQSYPFISAGQLSQLCGQILQLRLYRQTTTIIKQSNMKKIMQQLRRVGWQGKGGYSEVLDEQNNDLRWNLIKFVHELTKQKVYYYR